MTKPTYGGGGANTLVNVTFSGGTVGVPMCCATINEFVVIGGETAATFKPLSTVRWCAIGDPTDWPIPASDDARAKQAGEQTIPNNLGIITAVAGGDFFGYAFSERGITKMTYVGGDVVFTFDSFEENRGCWEYNRIAQVDDMVFFESEFGYHLLLDGQISDIGLGIVNDTYPPQRTLVGVGTHNQTNQQNVVANKAIDCVFFESQNLCYNYKTQQWTRVPALDGATFVGIDDASGIVGRTSVLAVGGVLMDQKGGTAQTAILTTGEIDLNQGGRAVLTGVKPLVRGGTVTVRAGTREDLSTTISYSSATSLTARTGVADFRKEGRYHRTEVTITGGFTTALGADIDFEPAGQV